LLREFFDDFRVLSRYPQLFPLCFAVFVSMLGFGLVMPLLPIYARDFGATGTQLGLMTTSFAIARLVTTFPGGFLADKVGRKRPVILGLLAYSVVMALYGVSQDVNQLILLRGLQGLASGVVWPPLSTMVADVTLPRDRSKAMGLYSSMRFFGMVVGPGLGGILTSISSIAVPFYACGALALVSGILVIIIVKETVGKERSDETVNSEGSDPPSRTKKGTLTPYLMTFIGLCIAQFVLAFSTSLVQPVLSVYVNEELGLNEAAVGLLFTMQGLTTLFATLPIGSVGDKTGRKKLIVLGQLLDVTSVTLLIIIGGFWQAVYVMMIRGLGRASTNPSIIAIFTTLVPLSRRGRSMSLFNIFMNVGLVAGATVGGLLYEVSSETPFLACAAVGLIGILMVILTVKEPKEGLH
jgi:multidrug resistance protein